MEAKDGRVRGRKGEDGKAEVSRGKKSTKLPERDMQLEDGDGPLWARGGRIESRECEKGRKWRQGLLCSF